MNINNFKNYINKTVLDRGYDYYIDGNIIETNDQGDNEYIFQVQGSENYEVVVKLDDMGEILYSECDCPYDFGPICKHEVAAFFELQEILNTEDYDVRMKKEGVKNSKINEVLNSLSKEELIDIIVDLTKNDSALKNSLIVRYSKDDDIQELEKCKKFIDSIVWKYKGREGYITYREAYGFVNEMEDLLDKVRDTDPPLLALDIAFLLLSEAVGAFEYADDSGGDIGELVTETIGLIEERISNSGDLDINVREQIFNKLLEQSENKVFDGWEDYKIEILRLCTEFADIEILRKKLIMKIECLVNGISDNGYMKYSNESMLKILFNLIEEYGTDEEAEQFIKENLKYTSFREQFINKYMKEKNYHKVIELALEGEKQDKNYAGLLTNWRKIRYTAYKELLMKAEQEKLAKELLFAGNFEYYSELKELVTWDKTVFYNNLIQELKKDKGWRGRDIYLKIIEEENDLDEIMEFVRENPGHIEEYARKLTDHFTDEVIEIYKKYIKSEAGSSSNRKEYQKVCGILKSYKRIVGKTNQDVLKNELIVLYKKRPAFVDELSKI
mgnify:CR=1 FL=1